MLSLTFLPSPSLRILRHGSCNRFGALVSLPILCCSLTFLSHTLSPFLCLWSVANLTSLLSRLTYSYILQPAASPTFSTYITNLDHHGFPTPPTLPTIPRTLKIPPCQQHLLPSKMAPRKKQPASEVITPTTLRPKSTRIAKPTST